MYRVKPQYTDKGQTPVTLVGGVAVCLGDTDAHSDLPGTGTKPPERRTAKMATQEQLAVLFREGHEMVEEYEA